MMQDLDKLIKATPDVDMDKAFGEFLASHEEALKGCDEYVEGLVPRLVFIADFLRLQTEMILGGDIKSSLKSLLIWAEAMDHGDVPMNFGNRTRMEKMAEILEKKARTLNTSYKDQVKKWAE